MSHFFKPTLTMLTAVLIFISVSVFGQRQCGTTIKNAENHFLYDNSNYKRNSSNLSDSIITIPVVFHVLYNNETENAEDAKMQSQIEVLNRDFRRKNEDTTNIWPQAADVGVEFCLAKVDINGNYFNGITRTFTEDTVFFYKEDDIFFTNEGGKDIWPGYLNIYVCNLGVNKYGVAGFSSLPGYDAYEDAVVMDYRFTGLFGELLSFNYAAGRTGTHEVGHWLNLIHPWGAEADSTCILDDYVEDTPQSSLPYMACDTGSTCGSVDMSDNFMDYHYDQCMNLFTKGQAERIRSTIFNHPSRTFLLNHTKCTTAFDSINIATIIENEVELIKACNQVTASNEVIKNADVTYVSATSVSLFGGFSVDKSSNLSVYIKPCI